MISSIIKVTDLKGTQYMGQIIDDVVLIYDKDSGDYIREESTSTVFIGWSEV